MPNLGRTLDRWARVYIGGYDLSGYIRSIGELKQSYDAKPDAALVDNVQNVVGVGKVSLGVGTLNGFFDNTATTGLHAVMNGAGVKRVVMVPKGIRAAPAMADPVYAGEFEQLGYDALDQNTYIVANIPFGDQDELAAGILYSQPWGVLLHANAAETAVNSAIGFDGGGSTSFGGWMCYQIFAGLTAGTVTLKVQDAAVNADGSFADVAGLTSGAINLAAIPTAGCVAIARTATVRQFTRWQLAFSGMTSVTFALSFHRATF